MQTDWRRYQIADLLSQAVLQIGDGYRAKNNELGQTGIPFARVSNISEGFQFQGADLFPCEHLDRVGSKVSKPFDVVFTSKGTIGRFAFVGKETQPFVYSPQLCYWRVQNVEHIEPRFLYYWMFGREFYLQYNGVRGQTDMADYVSLGDQRRMHITLPPLPEQRAIATILGSLDDKIELNRQMNTTLEAMARALFKSWFVDFDPVRAKMEGCQPPGMDADTAALFPDRFEESVLGEVPRGWHVGGLGNIAGNLRQGVSPSDIMPGTAYIGLDHMPRKSIALADWGVVEDVISGKSRFRRGDILFGKLRPYFHKVGVAVVDGVCSTDILVVEPKSREWFSLVLSMVSSVEFVNYTNASSGGTRMPRTNWQDMARYEVVLPPKPVAERFDLAVRPLVQLIGANILQGRTLADSRDALLPKLLSGELGTRRVQKLPHP